MFDAPEATRYIPQQGVPLTRFLDLLAFVILAVVVLLPSPGITVTPAISGERADLERLSQLEDALFRAESPDATPEQRQRAAALSVELARSYMTVGRPDWALATLAPALERGDVAAHQVAAYAQAERLRPAEALATAEAGLRACDKAGAACGEVARIRLSYLAEMMRGLASANVDPTKDPARARQLVREALHHTKAPPIPKPPGAK